MSLHQTAFDPEEMARERKTALRIVKGFARNLADTSSGNRDNYLIYCAYCCAKLVNMGMVTRSEVHDQLRPAVARWGDYSDQLAQDKIDRTLDDAARDGVRWDGELSWDSAEHSPAAVESSATDEFEENPTPVFANRILTRSALRDLPAPEPLIDNVLDQGTTALLYGWRGTIKTFIALDWAASVATGRRWQNRETQQRKSLYVVGEGANGFNRRVDAWEVGWQTDISDDWFYTYPHPVNLTNPSDVANLCALIDWGGYGFVVLDTLARCMVGAEENSAKDAGIVVDAMTRLMNCTPDGRGVILGVHHAGKDQKTLRGSSAFESGVDTVYFTSRDETMFSLNREKRKDGPELDAHEFMLQEMSGTKSCVVSTKYFDPTAADARPERAERLLAVFVEHFAETGATGAQLLDVSGMERPTFYRTLNELLLDGGLINKGARRGFYVLGSR